jgi:hypothetical protein
LTTPSVAPAIAKVKARFRPWRPLQLFGIAVIQLLVGGAFATILVGIAASPLSNDVIDSKKNKGHDYGHGDGAQPPKTAREEHEHFPSLLSAIIANAIFDHDAVVDLGDAGHGPGRSHRFVVLRPRAHRPGQDHRPVGGGIDGQLVRVQPGAAPERVTDVALDVAPVWRRGQRDVVS